MTRRRTGRRPPDAHRRFHEEWLGLAQPIEGLVFSVPVLADAQILPRSGPELTKRFVAAVEKPDGLPPLIPNVRDFFARFLGYDRPGMLVGRAALPAELRVRATDGGQEIRPSFALQRGPFRSAEDDPFVDLDVGDSEPPASESSGAEAKSPHVLLVWDLRDDAGEAGLGLPLDEREDRTGGWRYPPTAKFERLLRESKVPIGLLSNGRELRLVYAPAQESTSYLTFRVEEMYEAAGRPLLAAFDLLFSAERAYGAAEEFTLEGLLRESRRRQADVTKDLAAQVFEAVEILLAGFEQAAQRETDDRIDWLRAALEEPGDHLYQGLLSVVLRLVFLLYAEDRGLLPVGHSFYDRHLSLQGLFDELVQDAGMHPESMHHRFGAYGRLLALFRAIFVGVRHGDLVLPPRHGKLFDPSAYPFLEGGLPGGSAAINSPDERAEVRPPAVDDGVVHDVLSRLILFQGQRLSYRALDVEQIGSVYESLMGYHVMHAAAPAVRLGKNRVWVEADALREAKSIDRKKQLKEHCGLTPAQQKKVDEAIQATRDDGALAESLVDMAPGGKRDRERHRAAAGKLLLQPGPERRRSGSHYTPRSLTQRIVRRTLEPIFACLAEASRTSSPAGGDGRKTVPQRRDVIPAKAGIQDSQGVMDPGFRRGDRMTSSSVVPGYGRGGSPEGGEPDSLPEGITEAQLLSLKICDPAVGSGAFLVEACRQLGAALVTVWTREGRLAEIAERYDDAQLHAQRLVAQRCLYGVDKNPAAVELAKLSLWLVTLSKDLPFTFVDHTVRCGDSLVGLDLEQIAAFHWKPKEQLELIDVALRDALGQAIAHREEIVALADKEDAASQEEKRRLLDFAEHATQRIRRVADLCVGAFFIAPTDKAREAERKRRQELAVKYLGGDEDVVGEVEEMSDWIREQHHPFHWWVEFPEVFSQARQDLLEYGPSISARFDSLFGNPPYGGKNTIIDGLGRDYIPWLQVAHEGAHGNSDLSAHFFRRAAKLLGANGTMGFVATNSIAQGDTLESGLLPLVTGMNCRIFDATRSLKWSGGAAVEVSVIHIIKGCFDAPQCSLDGVAVRTIDSRLRPFTETSAAKGLRANAQCAFVGTYINGMGFVLEPSEYHALIGAEPLNQDRIRPYLGCDEVNSSPTQAFDRYVIDFGRLSLAEAESWPTLLAIVEERVKPERDRNNRPAYREKWWQFAEPRRALKQHLARLDCCLVIGRYQPHLTVAFQPTDRVLSEQLYVFPLDTHTTFAVLQSRVHEPWARLLSSSLEDRLRYAASDCFDTFPFPQPDPRTVIPAVEAAGEALYEARAKFMVATDQGLTKTYNALKDPANDDPEVARLRELHEAMDRAVLDAYGWTDVQVPPFCPRTPAEREQLAAFEDEVIDRLYVLNAERAEQEKAQGLTAKKGKQAKRAAKKKPDVPEQGSLL